MTRTLVVVDRVVLAVVGLLLVALGLLALDWKNAVVLDGYGDALHTGAAESVVTSSWWPWAFAAGGVVLGLLGSWWLLAHLRRQGPSVLRAGTSDETGRVEVDLRSVASAAAAHLAAIAPVVDPRGVTRTYGATTLVELRGHVDPAADVEALTSAAAECAAHVAAAFPHDPVECRVVLDAPQRSRTGRRVTRVRVR